MKNRWRITISLLGALCVAAPQARSQIEHHACVVGAGAVHGTNGTYHVRGTLAQAAVGYVAGTSIDAALGFWREVGRVSGTAREEEPTTGSNMPMLHASPNPFSESTHLSLRIPHNEHVSLVLYNLLGQPVRTLLAAEQSEGELNLDILADDLPSGRYTLILAAGDERQTLSLLLVR